MWTLCEVNNKQRTRVKTRLGCRNNTTSTVTHPLLATPPYLMVTAPCLMATAPCLMATLPYFMATTPFLMAATPYLMATAPWQPPLTSWHLYLMVTAPYLMATLLYLMATPLSSWLPSLTSCPLPHSNPPLPHGNCPLPHGNPSLPHGNHPLPHAPLPHGNPSLLHGNPSLPHGNHPLPHAPLPHGNPSLPHGNPALLHANHPLPHAPLLHGNPSLPHGNPSLPHGNHPLPHGNPSLPHGNPSLPHGNCPLPHGNPSLPHGNPSLPHGNPPYLMATPPYLMATAPYLMHSVGWGVHEWLQVDCVTSLSGGDAYMLERKTHKWWPTNNNSQMKERFYVLEKHTQMMTYKQQQSNEGKVLCAGKTHTNDDLQTTTVKWRKGFMCWKNTHKWWPTNNNSQMKERFYVLEKHTQMMTYKQQQSNEGKVLCAGKTHTNDDLQTTTVKWRKGFMCWKNTHKWWPTNNNSQMKERFYVLEKHTQMMTYKQQQSNEGKVLCAGKTHTNDDLQTTIVKWRKGFMCWKNTHKWWPTDNNSQMKERFYVLEKHTQMMTYKQQ